VGPSGQRAAEPRRRRPSTTAQAGLEGVHPEGRRSADHHHPQRRHRARRQSGRQRSLRRGRGHRSAISIPIICALLGAPRADWQLFSGWADDIFKVFDWNVVEDEPVIMAAWLQLEDYVDDMVARRRRHLTDDLLSDMIRAEEDGDRLSQQELRLLVVGLFAAGTDTTRNQLAASVQVLCEHSEQWAMFAAHPELASNAVEETMRHDPVIFATLRTAKEDVELGGVVIPTGAMFVVNTAGANRDPDVYEQPEAFDITREGAPAMPTFGGGIHYCLGCTLPGWSSPRLWSR